MEFLVDVCVLETYAAFSAIEIDAYRTVASKNTHYNFPSLFFITKHKSLNFTFQERRAAKRAKRNVVFLVLWRQKESRNL
jgi:presenilin-like A22 family membrane protease